MGKTPLSKSSRLFLRAAIIVGVIITLKLLAHYAGWESISLNPLFSGIVAANVFLMSFLLSGVLSDYKESERLPGELATSLETIAEEVRGICIARPEADGQPCLACVAALARDIVQWFHKQHRTSELMDDLNRLTDHFAALEKWTQATFLTRLKQEQANIRRTITRIHTIRETSFISSGYLVADATTVFLCVGLVLVRIDPFYESLFFVGTIAFLLVFLLLLIRDLDNPFGYYEGGSGEDVSLKPLTDTIARIESLVGNDKYTVQEERR